MGLSEFSLPVYSMVNFRALPTSSTISSCFIFTELYEENHVRAEQTALRILRDPHDAEDAVQNAFLQVIHHFDEISEIPCKKLGFWIISIVKNEALMILRRKQKELPQEDWDTFSADVSDPTSYNELVRLFSQLPPTYRAALEMRLINGYSGKEIAQHLGISESAVNTRISRGQSRRDFTYDRAGT